MSFADDMKKLAIEREKEIQEKNEELMRIKLEKLAERQLEVKREKFNLLNEKYFLSIRNNILKAASQGKREKHMNFDRNDFKANCPGLGGVVQFQSMWLNEITNPKSKYLLIDADSCQPLHISGISYDIWNNAAFTTVFSW